MSNTKNNHQPKIQESLKGKKMRDEEQHELFVQWLNILLRDDHGRAVIRAMVEQHEMPVIDFAHGERRATNRPACQPADFQASSWARSRIDRPDSLA
jgi:hypothetical protein